MENLSVNLQEYASGAGLDHGAAQGADLNGQQLNELNKALEAGQLQGGDLAGTQTNGGSLKTESLESSLKLITFKESDIRFWKRFPKTAAFNTVEEYNQLTSYGADRGGFNNEGELPEEEDSQYTRKVERVKYLGVTKSVTHQMQLVNTNIGSVVQRETTNGIMWILRKADRALFYGDEALVSQEWNGLYAQHLNNDQFNSLDEYMNSELVVDLRGKTLKQEDLENGSRVLLQKFAHADLLVAPPVVLSDFATHFYAKQRVVMGNSSASESGQHMSSFRGMYGKVDFEYDIFATKASGKLSSSAASHPKAPSAPGTPTVVVATADASSKFTDGIGDYFYAVAGVNRYGESAMTQIGATVTVANATDAVDLAFVAGTGPYSPASYIIYRSDVNPGGTFANTIMHPIMNIPAAGTDAKRGSLAAGVDGGAAGKVRDRNRYLPNTQEALLLQGDTDVIEFKQLAPLMKMPIAKLSPADRFMVLLYGTPIVYAPSKMVRYINIGRTH